MTLIVAMKTDGAIILAADSRGTVGDPRGLTAINDNNKKIFPLGNCGIAFAGASEMGAALLDALQQRKVNNAKNVDEAIAQVLAVSTSSFNQWFAGIAHAQRPPVIITLAGYRLQANQPPVAMIYLLLSQQNFAPQLFQQGICLTGVPQYATYLQHRFYDPAISKDNGKALAEYLISETASQDPKVGGPIRIVEITPEKGYTELEEVEVAEIHKRNEELNQQLREFFLKGEGQQ